MRGSRALACDQEIAPALQAKAGGFSAYAYELLPLMHTLMGHNKVETDLLSTDMLAFLSGFKGHITPVMQDFAANAKRGAMGREAASQKNHANSLVKVCSTDRFMHPTNVSDCEGPLGFGLNPVPYRLCMMCLSLNRGSCIPVALCSRYMWTFHAFQIKKEWGLTVAQPCAMQLSLRLRMLECGN